MEPRDSLFEMPLVCRLLDSTAEQVERMCSVLGIVPTRRNGESCLEREALRRLYVSLYPPYIPPEPAP